MSLTGSRQRAIAAARLAAVALGAALPLGGCVTPANDRSTIGHGPAEVRLEALTAESGRAGSAGADAPAGAAVIEPIDARGTSIRGLERGTWPRTTVDLVVDGTAHRPTYVRRVIGTDSSARQRGEFPTAEQALELTQDSGQDQAIEAVLQHGNAALDTVLLPVNMVIEAPWRTRWSPDAAHQRWAQPRPAMLGIREAATAVPGAAPGAEGR